MRPSEVVDKIIHFFVDIITPGRGTGTSSWWMRGIRSVQRSSQRIEKELEIRSHLAQWDDEFPFMHHELIIRYGAGLLASAAAIAVYDLFRSSGRSRRRH